MVPQVSYLHENITYLYNNILILQSDYTLVKCLLYIYIFLVHQLKFIDIWTAVLEFKYIFKLGIISNIIPCMWHSGKGKTVRTENISVKVKGQSRRERVTVKVSGGPLWGR